MRPWLSSSSPTPTCSRRSSCGSRRCLPRFPAQASSAGAGAASSRTPTSSSASAHCTTGNLLSSASSSATSASPASSPRWTLDCASSHTRRPSSVVFSPRSPDTAAGRRLFGRNPTPPVGTRSSWSGSSWRSLATQLPRSKTRLIEPKLANVLIRQLNQVCPLENLRHVKRVRRRTDCGKSELSIILCISNGSENYCEGFPEGVQKIVDTYQLSPFAAKVAKCSATSKEEWEEQCKLWPTAYHPTQDFEIRGFREEELPSIFNRMKTAIQLSKEGNAAIIVDPSSNQIIAKAKDQTPHHDTYEEGIKFSEVKEEDTCSLNESIQKNGKLSSSCLSKYSTLSMEVSCTNPWGWTKQKTIELKPLPCQGCFAWHPLQHAAMVAIEKAAERDRMLFTSSSTITKPMSNGHMENDFDNEPAKRLKTYSKDKEQSADGACCSDSPETTRPYLCTGFDIYLVWEPCAMCAMALVHQRFKRVFYAFPNPITGALGGVYQLHGEKSLNHHYNVFRISVPEAFLNSLTEC